MISDGFIQSSIRKQQQIVTKLQRFNMTWFPKLAVLLAASLVLFIVFFIWRDSELDAFTDIGKFIAYLFHFPGLDDDLSQVAGELTSDRLLGGLLSPNFTRRSCLSRYQSISYRKSSRHEPSSYLISRLREYERLHKRCGPYAESYKKSIKEMVSGRIDSSSACRYVVWVAKCGLGNRMLSITSAFLYALLTNRVLLIYEEADMANVFCEPFPDTTWLLPKDFPFNYRLSRFKQKYAKSFGNTLKNNNNKISVSTEQLPSHLYLYLSHDYSHHDKLFFCDQDQIVLRNIPWLIIKSDVYFLPSLFLMPSFEEELSKLFPDKETVFHHLGRYLFHPSNQVWTLITSYYKKYLAEAEERIGIQIRIFDKKTSPFQQVMDQILTCTFKEKLLPQVDMGKSIVAPSGKGKSKAVLLTSLIPSYYEKLKDMYLKHPTLNGEVINVYQPSHEEKQRSTNNVHNQKALAEINLLSMMDVLVTSAWSTFGYVAQGLAGKKPLILYKIEDKKIPNPVCGRAVSLEPCFHSPPIYDCKAKREVDTATIVPYLRHCEDIHWGIKLFNGT
ncbi:Galactoside 2-alpha-L-fucosyltransferase [Citrus sinensis]|uniref:Galactoside 2-alpha-L-fucosyltransferase n=1 Tax=Citrus sinensis TaxID=2711 RepID=A0ACB8KDL8_CITSI|nr:Galactoside 2-alpha-L-fucosyltransferase [Citrus sinensis]